MSKFNAIASAIVEGISKKPVIVLKAFASADPGYARAVVQITHRDKSRDKSATLNAIREFFDNKLTPVLNSWYVVESTAFADTICGILSANKQSIPYQENITGFHAISSNMFMDDEKHMWSLKETDGGKLLVKTSNIEDEDALNQLLTSFSSSMQVNDPMFGKVENAMGYCKSLTGGDFVSYVSRASNNLLAGFVVSEVAQENGELTDQIVVLAHGQENHEVINRNMVTSSFKLDALNDVADDKEMTAVAAGCKTVKIEDVLSYYRMLYQRNPDYFAAFEKRLSEYCFA